MALKSSGAGYPDHSKATVGNQGERIDQEPNSGKQILRKGGTAAEADIDVATESSPHDLIVTGDYDSGVKNAGGAEGLAGYVKSQDSATFTITVEWLDDDGAVDITDTPAALTDVTDIKFNLVMRSDRFRLKITDTSNGANNRINGSANAH